MENEIEGFEMVQRFQRNSSARKSKSYSKKQIEEMNRFTQLNISELEIPPFTNFTGPKIERIGKKNI